jgi:protoporphyrinogen oxidase
MKMVPDTSKCSLECEYFVEENCDLWRTSDENIIDMTKNELRQIGLISREDIIEGFVIRVPKAYPLLTTDYIKFIKIIYAELDGIDNLQLIGRGMHSYETMHHAILSGLLASRIILESHS